MTVAERIAEEISLSPIGKEDIARRMHVSWDTVHRWSKGLKKEFKQSEIKALSEILRVRYEYLVFGEEPKFLHPGLQKIGTAATASGKSNKELDQTLSGVELKAKNLIQDLQALVENLEEMRKQKE